MTPPPPPSAPNPASPLDPAELAGHVAWVQRLARALVRDAAAADDVAQETWRVTLAQPPGRVGGGARLRAWLGGVARRLALDRARSEASRAQRERTSGRDESRRAAQSGPHEPHEIVERSARQQRIVAAVMSLAEPYRSTVLYRYLDERPTRDVAERMAVSEEVVRKRLERGLAQLREQLDREFGAPTRQWAGLLLAGTGVVAMGAKAKAAVAAAVLIAASATTAWWWQRPERVEPTQAIATNAAMPVAPPSEVALATPTAERRVDAAPSRVEADGTPATAATWIPIEVVTVDGAPCLEGRIFGFWNEFPAQPRSSEEGAANDEERVDQEPRIRSFDVPITGEVTELRLPARTRSLLIAASVPGATPSTRAGMSDERSESEEDARAGRDHRWSTRQLEVGARLGTPALQGALLVDGVRRVPRGLAIDPQTALPDDSYVRIDAVAASYSIAPRPAHDFKLWVTSDETVPRLVAVEEDDDVVDLELAAGRTLELTVLDRATGRIAPGVELHATVDVITERGFFRQSWRDHSHFCRSGADGIARLAGLPDEGRVAIRRDARLHEVQFEPSPKQPGWAHGRMVTLADPLLTIALDDDGPALVRATLRIDVERPTRRLFGTVPAAFLERGPYDEPPVQLFWAKESAGERTERRDTPIVPRADGSWSLEVTPDASYLVWGERERRRCSRVARVTVVSDDVGPIAIEPRGGAEVLVRVRRCPADGWINVDVDDPGAVTPLGSVFASSGGTFERRVALDGPTAITVRWRKERGTEGGSAQRRVVDPATTSLVEFDLAGEGAREVAVELDHGTLSSESLLVLFAVDEQGALDRDRRATLALRGGRGAESLALAPGRWLWFVAGARGVIAGVADVPPPSVGVPLTLRAALEARSAAEIGRGFTVESLADVEIPAELRKLLQWTALGKEPSVELVLVPAEARIALREE